MDLKTRMEIHDDKDSIVEKILEKYNYGSHVYGSNTPESDYDYIVIVESDDDLYYSVNTDTTVYSEKLFIDLIKEHRIYALECIFQSEDDKYVKYFNLDKSKLREAISSVSSNSFVKAKKKINQGEIRIGQKSLFHSLRILDFGIQIATNGKIVDYSSSNHYLEDILKHDNWDVLNKKYKPIFNYLKTEFKKVAPKEGGN